MSLIRSARIYQLSPTAETTRISRPPMLLLERPCSDAPSAKDDGWRIHRCEQNFETDGRNAHPFHDLDAQPRPRFRDDCFDATGQCRIPLLVSLLDRAQRRDRLRKPTKPVSYPGRPTSHRSRGNTQLPVDPFANQGSVALRRYGKHAPGLPGNAVPTETSRPVCTSARPRLHAAAPTHNARALGTADGPGETSQTSPAGPTSPKCAAGAAHRLP